MESPVVRPASTERRYATGRFAACFWALGAVAAASIFDLLTGRAHSPLLFYAIAVAAAGGQGGAVGGALAAVLAPAAWVYCNAGNAIGVVIWNAVSAFLVFIYIAGIAQWDRERRIDSGR